MERRKNESQGQEVHGLVTLRLAVAGLLLAGVAASLVSGVAGGLLRAGLALAEPGGSPWLLNAALSHAALMMGGFFGTVIGIERAVASGRRLAWSAPLVSAAGAFALLMDAAQAAAWLLLAASLCFTAVNVLLWRKQRAAHTALLVASALAWVTGNSLFLASTLAASPLPWWYAFLVMTIAAERLEMTRLMRRHPHATFMLVAALGAQVAGAALSAWHGAAGGVLFGLGLLALAAWLLAFDIARRTVLAHGLSRYMAVCLLTGYGWLAIGGLAWAATAQGWPARDAALHALGLGFIISMVMGHAPVILPAIARVKLHFTGLFYLPLALLHASLAWRLAGPFLDNSARSQGAALNAAALAAFLLTVVGAAFAWRRHHPY